MITLRSQLLGKRANEKGNLIELVEREKVDAVLRGISGKRVIVVTPTSPGEKGHDSFEGTTFNIITFPKIFSVGFFPENLYDLAEFSKVQNISQEDKSEPTSIYLFTGSNGRINYTLISQDTNPFSAFVNLIDYEQKVCAWFGSNMYLEKIFGPGYKGIVNISSQEDHHL